MKLLKAALVLGLVLGLTAVPTMDAVAGPANYAGADKKQKEGPTKRTVFIKEVDTNGDWELKKKELKAFDAGHPNMYNQLMQYCEKAVDAPGKFDVKFPPGAKAKKFKCKKSKVSKPYLKAWAKRGKPAETTKHN